MYGYLNLYPPELLKYLMHFIINLNKPKGISSQEAVTRVKRHLGVKKAGHAGTLDPMASGVLLICVGEATKIARFLSDMDKGYIATLKLGERTDTFDKEGRIVEKKDCSFITLNNITHVLEGMRGSIMQTPPMYSAIKHKGKPLYSLARKGIEVQRPQRRVNIHELSIRGFNLPFLELLISCSKGTYIRSIAEDIGKALGVGAHIIELKRTRIGNFRLEDSVGLASIRDGLKDKAPCLIEIDKALNHLKEIILKEEDFSLAKNGTPVILKEFGRQQEGLVSLLRVKSPEGKLFAIGTINQQMPLQLKIQRLLYI